MISEICIAIVNSESGLSVEEITNITKVIKNFMSNALFIISYINIGDIL